MDTQTAMLLAAVGSKSGLELDGTVTSAISVVTMGTSPRALIAHKTEPYLYVGTTAPQSVRIIDISEPASMVDLGKVSVGTSDSCAELIISHDGNYLFAINQPGSDTDGNVDVYDISSAANARNPVHVRTNTDLYYKYHASAAIHPTQDYIYTGGGNSRLNVVDISDPTAPLPRTLRDVLPDPENQMSCSSYGLFYPNADVANRMNNLDISDATNPIARASTNSSCKSTVITKDKYMYTMSYDYGVRVSDVTDINSIVLAGSDITNKADIWQGTYGKMIIADNILFQPNGSNALCTADISDPANPEFLGKQIVSSTYLSSANLIAIVDDNAFVTNYSNNTISALKLGTK